MAQRERIPGLDPSDPNALVHVIARCGPAGISRRDLGKIVKLSPPLLSQLLAMLCSMGQLQVSTMGGQTIYRAIVGW